MHDVAGVAGVSLSTVSRVVNGQGGVRADLAERVRDAVDLLGYRRDLTASTLRRADRVVGQRRPACSRTCPTRSSPPSTAGSRKWRERRGVLIFVGSSDEDPERERELVHGFCGRRVDGLVVAPVARDQSYLLRELAAGMARRLHRPPARGDRGRRRADRQSRGGAGAVDHLVEAGHRRIAFLGDREQIFTARERRGGYREALARHLIPLDDDAGANRPRRQRLELPGDAGAARGSTSRRRALLTSQNLITIGAVRALRPPGASTTWRWWASTTWCWPTPWSRPSPWWRRIR